MSTVEIPFVSDSYLQKLYLEISENVSTRKFFFPNYEIEVFF